MRNYVCMKVLLAGVVLSAMELNYEHPQCIANEWCGAEHTMQLPQLTHSPLLASAGQYGAAVEFELLIARPRFASAMCKSGWNALGPGLGRV